jgi:hypothetical protein
MALSAAVRLPLTVVVPCGLEYVCSPLVVTEPRLTSLAASVPLLTTVTEPAASVPRVMAPLSALVRPAPSPSSMSSAPLPASRVVQAPW